MIKAVLFDMDGILIDSEIYYMQGTYQFMKQLGFKGRLEDVYTLIGTTMSVTYDMIFEMLDKRYSKEEIKRINEEYFTENKIDYQKAVFDGVKETLIELKSVGLKLAVCSSSPLDVIYECIKALEIESLFDLVVCGDQFKESKPNPEIYQFAMQKLGVTPSESIIYEDSKLGIMAGINAGVFTVARCEKRFGIDQSAANLMVDNIVEFKEYILRRIGESNE